MKKYALCLLTVMTAGLFFVSPLQAAVTVLHRVHVEWTYGSPPPELQGFRLYKDGVPLPGCETTNPAARQMDCDIDIGGGGPISFTLTAFGDNVESGPSGAVVVNPRPDKPQGIQAQ